MLASEVRRGQGKEVAVGQGFQLRQTQARTPRSPRKKKKKVKEDPKKPNTDREEQKPRIDIPTGANMKGPDGNASASRRRSVAEECRGVSFAMGTTLARIARRARPSDSRNSLRVRRLTGVLQEVLHVCLNVMAFTSRCPC